MAYSGNSSAPGARVRFGTIDLLLGETEGSLIETTFMRHPSATGGGSTPNCNEQPEVSHLAAAATSILDVLGEDLWADLGPNPS